MPTERSSLTLVLAVAMCGSAVAQDAPPTDTAEVNPEPTRPTLIARDIEGRLLPLDVRPEFAAIELLGLNDQELSDARSVIERRNAVADRLVLSNWPMLMEVNAAMADAGPGALLHEIDRELATRYTNAFNELWSGSHLSHEIKRKLPASSRGEYGRLVSDWLIAAMDQARADGPVEGLWPFEIVMLHAIQWEIDDAIRRAFEADPPAG